MSKKYEQIFTKNFDDFHQIDFFNLVKTFEIYLDDSNEYDVWLYDGSHWTDIAYKFYNSPELWWIICVVNQISDPFTFPSTGTKLKIPKRHIVTVILNTMNEQI